MRIRTLATCLLLLASACTGELTDDPGTDPGSNDPGPGSNPGSGGSNDGKGTFAITADQTAIATELMTDNTLNLTVTGAGGFKGDVALVAQVTDAAGTVLPGWTITLASPTASIAAENGTATVAATIKVPSAGALVGNVKIQATSGQLTGNVNATVTAANQVTFKVQNDGATCATNNADLYGNAAKPIPVMLGSTIRILNASAGKMVVHSGGNASIPHQADSGLTINQTYDNVVKGAAGNAIQWYCHAPGPAPANAVRPTMIVVAP